MKWNYPKKAIVNKRVTVKYSEITQDSARTSVFNQLGYPVFIDGTTSQKGGFQQFLGELFLTSSILFMISG
jgi:hypothetical protein